jgi:LysM repeat protein
MSPGKSGNSYAKKTEEKPKEIAKQNTDPNHHIVAQDETLASISQQHKCSVDDLKKWNNLNDNTIHPDQKLLVTAPKEEIVVAEKQPEIIPEKKLINDEYIYHTVRRGDTLWDIARQYEGVSVEQIKRLNNIYNSKTLKPGQKLKVAQKG